MVETEHVRVRKYILSFSFLSFFRHEEGVVDFVIK